MKSALVALALVFLSAAALAAEGRSPTKSSSPAPAPAGNDGACSKAVTTGMISCLGYVQAGGSQKIPDKACCDGTKAVLSSFGETCLCNLLSSASGYGVNVNLTRAAALPGLCHISSVPKCLRTGPGTAPVGPALAPAPSSAGKGSKGVAAPAPAPSGSPAAGVSYGLMAVVGLVSLALCV